MKVLKEGLYTGERALYNQHDVKIEECVFEDGESPLKECSNLDIQNSIFRWKYPLWYSHDVKVENSTLLDTARSGIWYTYNLEMNDCMIEAPKTFRRAHHVTLNNCTIPNAEETFWNCHDIQINHVSATGNYFGFNCENVEVNHLLLTGNYCFDGAKNVVVRNSKLNSKDSFWNCENVEIYDSYIIGEYLAWNSKNVKFVNCIIESEQGLCYLDNVELINCKLIHTNLCFELCSNIKADITTHIDSVKNPISGTITCPSIGELILDEHIIDPSKTSIHCNQIDKHSDHDIECHYE